MPRTRPRGAQGPDDEFAARMWRLNPNNPDCPPGTTHEDRQRLIDQVMNEWLTGDPNADTEQAAANQTYDFGVEEVDPDILRLNPGYGPGKERIHVEDLQDEAKRRVPAIFQHYDLLGAILERHEGTIAKRWKKKTKDQKRKILVSSWTLGEMPQTHRPDFAGFRKFVDSSAGWDYRRNISTRYRSSFMWPFINQEDLLKPRSLLLFMAARAKNLPSEFATGDLQAMHIGRVTDNIQPGKLKKHTMCLTGRYDESSYGQLLKWDDHPDAAFWADTKKQFQPGEGLLVLESQERTLEFLVNCAKAILHDIPDEKLLEYPLVAGPSPPELETGTLASWAAMTEEGPYRLPAQLSFARIQDLLKAKRDAFEDHMFALREDPAYFEYTMFESWEHRQEHILDYRKERHPLFKYGREDLLWSRVICDEVSLSFITIEHWTYAQQQAAELQFLQDKYAGKIDPEKDLPEEYLLASLTFREQLEHLTRGAIGQLKVSIMASPECRPYFIREAHDDPTAIENITSRKATGNQGLSRLKFEFFWIFHVIWEDDWQLESLRLTNLLDELQRMIESEREVQNLLSSVVAEQIANLSIAAECLRQLDLYQPWAAMFESQSEEHEDAISEALNESRKSWEVLLGATKGSEATLAKLGSPTDKRFYYPIEKRRTRETTEAMRQAEKNLDAFWHKVDECLHRKSGGLEGTVIRQLMLEPRSLNRTPEWVEPATTGTGSKPKPADQPHDLVKPLSELYFELERRTESTIDSETATRAPKAKPKTRGEPSAAVVETDPGEEDIPSEPEPPVFEVDAQALKVFRTLFYTPSPGATPGDVKWTDFLHAMASTGFKPEKLYGSVWQFTPTSLDVERSIQIHEPHGSMGGKIPYYIARRHGRRLARNYGWNSDMFVLASKTSR